MPWQEGPESFTGAPVWRYSEKPIIGRNPLKNVVRIFNSAVMPYGDSFIGVFRGGAADSYVGLAFTSRVRMCETIISHFPPDML